jgi:GGDEF domain-containing protein
VIVADVYSANKANLEICRMLKDDFITASIPVITLINKRQLRSQLLNLKQGVDDYLIKPPDPLDLRIRVEMAMRRAQYSLYASPLTGLPGGRNIEEVLKEKVKASSPFSFGYLDIDNFKYFNDVYGYLKGDRAIMNTAYMLYTTVKRLGNKDDFIGHIGGDDFVFITTPDRHPEICDEFIRAFDRLMPFHYTRKDRSQGFIIARDRSRNTKNIPLMSMSIAVVSKNGSRDLNNIIEINERVAEVKRYLKSFPGSKYMEDRRQPSAQGMSSPEIYTRDADLGPYRPIGQVLLEENMITSEELDEALAIHWRRGVLFGEVLKELGFIKEDELGRILQRERGRIETGGQKKKGVTHGSDSVHRTVVKTIPDSN